jgi:hypothetical protein
VSDDTPVLHLTRRGLSTVSDAPVSPSTSHQRSFGDDQDTLALEDDEDQDMPADARDESPLRHTGKRKHQVMDASSAGDDDAQQTPVKATKINRNAGRPRASDYEDLAKEFILLAATVYRCLLSTENAFPDLATEANMVKEAWGSVINEMSGTPLALTPDIAKIVSVLFFKGPLLKFYVLR